MFFNLLNKIKNLFTKKGIIIVRRTPRPGHPGPQKQPPANPPVVSNALINFYYNDPSTPHLVSQINPPTVQPEWPTFSVQNYQGGGAAAGSPEANAAQVYATICSTLNFFEGITKISNWAAVQNLMVLPRAGEDFNAFYDRSALRFFYENDATGKMIYTCNAVDIVSHELGHALLDCLRPQLWSTQASEVWAFHESWADIVAILTALHFDPVVDQALAETNNNIGQSNVISRLAEEMGIAIYGLARGQGGRLPNALRDAVNDFVYTNPDKLSQNAPDNQLANECHSFSRVFTGTWYEILVEIFNINVSRGQVPKTALINARDAAGRLIIRAVSKAALNPRFFESVARAMLLEDHNNDSTYNAILNKVFNKRNILKTTNIKALSNVHYDTLEIDKKDIVIKHKTRTAVIKKHEQVKNISDNVSIRALNANPLFSAEIETACESYLEFDLSGQIVHELKFKPVDAATSAKQCLKYIYDHKLYGTKDDNKQFILEDNKLTRNYICRLSKNRPH